MMMFKLGAMSMLLVFLTLIAVKTLGLVLFLIISHVSGFLAKIHLLKFAHATHAPSKQVHVHLHKEPQHYTEGGWRLHSHSDWDRNENTPYRGYRLNRNEYLEDLYHQQI